MLFTYGLKYKFKIGDAEEINSDSSMVSNANQKDKKISHHEGLFGFVYFLMNV